MEPESLQERYAPYSVCFGCGPANEHGLRVRSFVEGGSVVARWTPMPHHHAFDGVLNGGIISTVLDCHSNWAAAYALMLESGARHPPATVTSWMRVEFLKPTPVAGLHLVARPAKTDGRRVEVESELKAGGEVTATFSGVFVSVGPGHPAAKRWSGEGGTGGR